jgi:hypothetical protein
MRLEVRALPPERTRGSSRGAVQCRPDEVPVRRRVAHGWSGKVPSSSGLGHHPLKVETRVRTPLGLLSIKAGQPLFAPTPESPIGSDLTSLAVNWPCDLAQGCWIPDSLQPTARSVRKISRSRSGTDLHPSRTRSSGHWRRTKQQQAPRPDCGTRRATGHSAFFHLRRGPDRSYRMSSRSDGPDKKCSSSFRIRRTRVCLHG